MLILILFSFLAGIVTILSPCILPILPVVLSASVGGGKRRPLGIVSGFILSFTFFTLFLSTIVRLLHIPADSLRIVSIVVIFIFGLSFVIPKIQTYIELLFSRLMNRAPRMENKNGYLSGVLIGLSIGLLWTPCVGPILASVIALAISGTVTGQAVAITLAYSIGTAIPMLIITYTGASFFRNMPGLYKKLPIVQRVFGFIMIATAIAILFNFDRTFQTYILTKFPSYGTGLTKLEQNQAVQKALGQVGNSNQSTQPQNQNQNNAQDVSLSNLGNAPELIPGGEWFNTKPLKLSSLRGKVVLIDFWTYTCINCIRTLPYLRSWYDKYSDKGLVIIGVHTPEFEFEKSADNVKKAISDFGLKYPVMQDNNYATWNAYSNQYWPAEYLIDANGNIRHTHFGEGKYDETEAVIQKLLGEAGDSVSNKIDNPTYQVDSNTPELYLGYYRLFYYSYPDQIVRDKKSNYMLLGNIPRNNFAYVGMWTEQEFQAVPDKGSQLVLDFQAKDVYLVMRSSDGNSGKLKVYLDDNEVSADQAGDDVNDGIVQVNEDRLYNLIKLTKSEHHLLRIEFLDSNLEVYAFTFG